MTQATEQKMTGERWAKITNAFLEDAGGVIHVGANIGQEREIYAEYDLPVIWIEPLDGIFQLLVEHLADYPDQVAYQYLITDENDAEYDMGVANNGAQSSSIYDFALHKELWPEVGYVGWARLRSVTLKAVIDLHMLNQGVFDTLIMDVQGAELLVLKGAGEYLERFKWIRAECADFELYAGSCQLKDLDEYLLPRGFERIDLWRAHGKPGIGYTYEALYRRK